MSGFDDRRLDQRNPSYAKILLELETPVLGYLADVSPPGFRIRTLGQPPVRLPERCRVGVVFTEAGIPLFHLAVSLAWRRTEGDSLLLGCKIEAFPDNEAKTHWQHILDVYAEGENDGPCNEFIVSQG